jgi:hypothetical protein
MNKNNLKDYDLMEALDLKIGDTITINKRHYTISVIDDRVVYGNKTSYYHLINLIDKNFTKEKTLGSCKCTLTNCSDCPLLMLDCSPFISYDYTINDVWDNYIKDAKAQEVYDEDLDKYMRNRLNKRCKDA